MVQRQMRLLLITPKYSAPETIGSHLKLRVDPMLNRYSHIAIVDADTRVPSSFYELPNTYPTADIIGARTVVATSRIFRTWERLTYWVKLKPRIRGCAVIYSTAFLEQVGGWPLVTTPDTWLEQRAKTKILAPVMVIHEQRFSIRHSIHTQIRDGRSRAELNYPFWMTVLHSLFRVRPFVLFAHLWYWMQR